MKADVKLDDTRVFIEGDRVGVGVSDPQFKMDVGDRMAVRQGPSMSAGIWFYQNNTASDRAFVGMENDHSVGFWANKEAGGGPGWAVVMNTQTGDLDVRKNLKAGRVTAETVAAERFLIRIVSKIVGPGGQSVAHEIDLMEMIRGLTEKVNKLTAEVEALKKKK